MFTSHRTCHGHINSGEESSVSCSSDDSETSTYLRRCSRSSTPAPSEHPVGKYLRLVWEQHEAGHTSLTWSLLTPGVQHQSLKIMKDLPHPNNGLFCWHKADTEKEEELLSWLTGCRTGLSTHLYTPLHVHLITTCIWSLSYHITVHLITNTCTSIITS